MPIFIVKKTRTIIVTSYKVMYTNLRYGIHNEVDIQKLRWHNFYYRYLLLSKRYRSEWHVILFVRNPYERLLSLYLNKIIDYSHKVKNGEIDSWEACHKVLFKEMDISRNGLNFSKADSLLHLCFYDFVDLVEKVKFKEKHYFPQVFACQLGVIPFSNIRLKPDEVIELEGLDVSYIIIKTGIDLGEKINASNLDGQRHLLDKRSKEKIYRIYSEDFIEYGYET